MKILTILGSPRKRGNTEAVLDLFEARAAEKHALERVRVIDFNVKGCLGCDACQKKLDEPGCKQKDDFLGILEKIRQADLVIYAAPVYVWSFPAQMKALMDRHYCTVKWKDDEKVTMLLKGKRAALLLTCGGGEAENADLIRVEFEREMEYTGCQVCGIYAVDNCGSPKEMRAQKRGADTVEKMVLELGL